jgi:hypothetical protein
MKLAISLLLVVLVTLFSANALAQPYLLLDKSTYSYGNTIKVSGSVEYQDGMFIIIQVRSPSDIVAIDQIFPARSGKFSASFEAEGPKWEESGTYTVLVSYQGQKAERTFQFSKPQPTPTETPTVQQPVQEPTPTPKPKVTIKGFPDPTKSPQYYYERYSDDVEFKRWFDVTFAGYTIQDVVGYKPTGVAGFPDPNQPPQYYIDRYNNEKPFREWFDQYFPEKTIYDIVGITEQIRTIAPSWIKQYAKMWSGDEIDDRRFIEGIADLIRQNIIEVNTDITKQDSPDKTIPVWFKRNADWYSQDLISEDDFLSGIQYLIEKEIIVA